MVVTNWGQEALYRNGNLVGFNAGYHEGWFFHDFLYSGPEQMRSSDKNKDNPFYGQIVENPEVIKMVELGLGHVMITNDSKLYNRLSELSDSQRLDTIIDRFKLESCVSSYDPNPEDEDVIALWTAGNGKYDGRFYLISNNQQGDRLLRKLYESIKQGNVAISSGYRFLFEDRGLSFILLDQLSPEDFRNKELENQSMSKLECEFYGLPCNETSPKKGSEEHDEWII